MSERKQKQPLLAQRLEVEITISLTVSKLLLTSNKLQVCSSLMFVLGDNVQEH